MSQAAETNNVVTAVAKRAVCSKCSRPKNVCLCPYLPAEPMPTQTSTIIVQSKAEAKGKVKTADLVSRCLANSKVLPATKQSEAQIPDNCIVLFPGPGAEPLDKICRNRSSCTILVIDATWDSAKRIIKRSEMLQALPKAYIPEAFIGTSLFKARKPPTSSIQNARSTGEAIASALDCIEGDAVKEVVRAIREAIHAASEMQLGFIRAKGTNAGKHRKDRPGYHDGLYEA